MSPLWNVLYTYFCNTFQWVSFINVYCIWISSLLEIHDLALYIFSHSYSLFNVSKKHQLIPRSPETVHRFQPWNIANPGSAYLHPWGTFLSIRSIKLINLKRECAFLPLGTQPAWPLYQDQIKKYNLQCIIIALVISVNTYMETW